MASIQPAAAQTENAAAVASRLRLKRFFLRSLVISLVACAAVAVCALLAAAFNETTAKILSTLGALALHSGFAMVCAAMLEKARRPFLNMTGLSAAGVSFIVLMICVWVPGWFGEPTGKAVLSTGAMLGAYILAVPGSHLAEHSQVRTRRRLGLAGLAVGVLAFLMTLVCIWAEPTGSLAFPKATGVVALTYFSLAHTSLLVRAPRERTLDTVRWLAIGALWAPAALASVMIIWELDDDVLIRTLGALGVIDTTSSLALLILTRLRQVGRADLQTSSAQVELRCPRCLVPQTVAAGAARCQACGLRFRIDIEEPRCPRCEYVLWGLPERRCPECGTPF